MTTITEALRLAAELDAEIQRTVQVDMMHHNAATELRRLHEENGRLRIVAEMSTLLLDQRSALLEALRRIGQRCPRSIMKHPPHLIHQEMAHDAGAWARAAIKAVEGEQA